MAKPNAKKTGKGKKPSTKPASKVKKAAKGKKAAPKAKAKAKEVTPAVVQVPHKKQVWMVKRPILPATGTRFKPNTSQQLAFDIVLKGALNGKTIGDIRAELKQTRKDNGAARNLDPGYYNLVVACHPEFFEAWNTGELKVLQEPEVDPEAVKKLEEDKANRKKKAAKARGTKTTKKPVKAKGKGKKAKGRVVKKK